MARTRSVSPLPSDPTLRLQVLLSPVAYPESPPTDTRIFTNGVKGPWIAADKPSTASPFPQLYLVRQEQKGGSRTQWSIVICDGDKNNYRGPTWQVKGDPNKGMTFFEVEVREALGSAPTCSWPATSHINWAIDMY